MAKDDIQRRIDRPRGLRSGDSSNSVLQALQNVDKVDGFDASDKPSPGKLLALNSRGKFPASVLPSAQGEGAEGFGGLTIFGTGLSYLMEAIDGTEDAIKVYHRVFTTDQYVWLKPSFADDRKGKIGDDGLKIEGGWEYTIDWTVDPRAVTTFERGQSVIGIGADGEGYITADARAQYSDRPFMDFIERMSDSAWGHRTRTRIGNLAGLTTNGIDTLTNPTGWGIWTENLYGRGEFYSGYPGGPEVRIRRRTLGNGQTIHGMEWLYTPSARWWVQWYNETNQRVFWAVRKPAAPGSPESDLIRLLYRQGDPGVGEPDGVWDYYLNIDATTVIGELIAGRITVRGQLSAAVSDFGIVKTGALYLGTADYNDTENRSGLYVWAYRFPTIWGDDQGHIEDKGFEFYHSGVLQGKWDYDLGALAFGPNQGVRLSATGLDLLTSSEVLGVDDRSLTWVRSDDVTKKVGQIYGRYSTSESAVGIHGMNLHVHDFPSGGYSTILNYWQAGFIRENGIPLNVFQMIKPTLADQVEVRFDPMTVIAMGFPGGLRYSSGLVTPWEFVSGGGAMGYWRLPQADLAAGTVQTAMSNRQISVGRVEDTANSATYHVIGFGTFEDDLVTPQVNLIGIDYDTVNGRVVFRDQAGAWRRYDGTAA